MISLTQRLLTSSVLVLAAASLAVPAAAQQPPAQTAPKSAPKQPSATAQPQRPAAAAKDDTPARSGDPALRQRIEQLEEQLADMQVMIGTLESLGRGGSAPASASEAFRAPAGGGGGVDQARIDSLETQMRAISDQLEQLAAQVRSMTGRRGEAPPAAAPFEPPSRQAAQDPRAGAGFGSVTVTPGDRGESDPIGRIISSSPSGGAPPASPASAQPLPPPVANAGNPKELYETAYGYLLQQDYGSAEVAFEEFLRRHPNDRLAADAQYWLGEALYVQRQYKTAGQAFLKVIEKHKTSSKVPNSLLKLAMTLDQLGQKDCALFEELETRHPNATADVKGKARALKQRVGC